MKLDVNNCSVSTYLIQLHEDGFVEGNNHRYNDLFENMKFMGRLQVQLNVAKYPDLIAFSYPNKKTKPKIRQNKRMNWEKLTQDL